MTWAKSKNTGFTLGYKPDFFPCTICLLPGTMMYICTYCTYVLTCLYIYMYTVYMYVLHVPPYIPLHTWTTVPVIGYSWTLPAPEWGTVVSNWRWTLDTGCLLSQRQWHMERYVTYMYMYIHVHIICMSFNYFTYHHIQLIHTVRPVHHIQL